MFIDFTSPTAEVGLEHAVEKIYSEVVADKDVGEKFTITCAAFLVDTTDGCKVTMGRGITSRKDDNEIHHLIVDDVILEAIPGNNADWKVRVLIEFLRQHQRCDIVLALYFELDQNGSYLKGKKHYVYTRLNFSVSDAQGGITIVGDL